MSKWRKSWRGKTRQRNRKKYNDNEHNINNWEGGSGCLCFIDSYCIAPLFCIVYFFPWLLKFLLPLYFLLSNGQTHTLFFIHLSSLSLNFVEPHLEKKNYYLLHRITSSFGTLGKTHNTYQKENIGFEACTKKALISGKIHNKFFASTLANWN